MNPIPVEAMLDVPPGKRKEWIEGFAVPNAMRAMMQMIGEKSGFTDSGDWYHTETFPLFMGVCGDAFRFTWYRQDGAKWKRSDACVAAPAAGQYLLALEAAGFTGRVILDTDPAAGKADPAWEATNIQREIVTSIARRQWPALVIDVPEPGWTALITGYRDNGETLVGWCEPGWESFGFRFDPAKKREFTDWFGKAKGVVLLMSGHERPAEPQVLQAALRRAVPELTRRSVAHLHTGLATYEVLAKLLEDPSLSGDDPEVAKRRDALLFPMIWDLATQRYYASIFLHRSAEVFPSAAGDLNAASDSFKAIHDAVWEINRLGGGKNPGSPLPELADPAVRQQVVQIILQCRDRDLGAASRIEAGLGKMH